MSRTASSSSVSITSASGRTRSSAITSAFITPSRFSYRSPRSAIAVLLTPSCTLHLDEVDQRSHPDLQPVDVDPLGACLQVVISASPRRCPETIQIANIASEREAVTGSERARIQAKWNFVAYAAQLRVHLLERYGEPLVISRGSRVA